MKCGVCCHFCKSSSNRSLDGHSIPCYNAAPMGKSDSPCSLLNYRAFSGDITHGNYQDCLWTHRAVPFFSEWRWKPQARLWGITAEADRRRSLSRAAPWPLRSDAAGQTAFFLALSLCGLILGWPTCKAICQGHVYMLWLNEQPASVSQARAGDRRVQNDFVNMDLKARPVLRFCSVNVPVTSSSPKLSQTAEPVLKLWTASPGAQSIKNI